MLVVMKMKNKVLIKIIVPETDDTFDLFIPVNEVIWKVKKLLIKAVGDITQTNVSMDDEYVLMNASTNTIYDNNQVIIDTDIRNATELIMIPVK